MDIEQTAQSYRIMQVSFPKRIHLHVMSPKGRVHFCSKLNELSGIDVTACGILMGRQRRMMKVNAPLPPLVMPLMKDPGA